MNTKLKENEKILNEGSANYFSIRIGVFFGISAGGKLYLTNERVIFEGKNMNIGKEYAVINIKNIVNCDTGFPNILKIFTGDNKKYEFSVNGKKVWQKAINELL